MKKSIIKLNNTGKKIKMKGGGGLSENPDLANELANAYNAVGKTITRREAADKAADKVKATPDQAATRIQSLARGKAARRRRQIERRRRNAEEKHKKLMNKGREAAARRIQGSYRKMMNRKETQKEKAQ